MLEHVMQEPSVRFGLRPFGPPARPLSGHLRFAILDDQEPGSQLLAAGGTKIPGGQLDAEYVEAAPASDFEDRPT